MHILILNWRDPHNPKTGGAEFVTMMHARAWVAKGHSVTWFTSSFPGAKGHESIGGVRIIRRGQEHSVILLAPIFYLLKRQTFDIVIDQIHGLPFFTPLYVRVPIIAFIHEVAGDIWDRMYPFPINIVGRAMELLYLRLYRNIPFWTDAQATIGDLVKHGVPIAQCMAIPCPPLSRVISKFPQKERKPTFLFVSRIVQMKGIEEVIRAFSFIVPAIAEARLWVIGTGERRYVARVKDQIAALGLGSRVTLHGYVSEQKKLSLMRRAHLLLHASIKEGWGLVVLEAASQGTPAVVYNVHGLSEVVLHGKTGVVTRRNTPEDLAQEAVALYRDARRYASYQRNGIDRVKSLRWDDVTQRSLDLLVQTYETDQDSHD